MNQILRRRTLRALPEGFDELAAVCEARQGSSDFLNDDAIMLMLLQWTLLVGEKLLPCLWAMRGLSGEVAMAKEGRDVWDIVIVQPLQRDAFLV